MKLSKQFISYFKDDPKFDHSKYKRKAEEDAFKMINESLNIK